MPKHLVDGFPPMPMLRNALTEDQCASLCFPEDETRSTYAMLLTEIAFQFLIFHEIGHIVGGHFEILSNQKPCAGILSELNHAVPMADGCQLLHVLECDADAFACHATSSI